MTDGRNPFDDDAQAAGYDGWFASPVGRVVDRLQGALVEHLARPWPGERALDVGTGTGHYATRLAERGLHVTGCDASNVMLGAARAKCADVTWCLASAERLPFDDGAFDLVLSVTMLEFVRDPEGALAEMWRVTAPGGRLVVGVLNAESAWGRFYRQQAERAETPFRHARLYTPERLLGALRMFGRPRWGSSVFFAPSGRWVWAADGLEWLGQHLWLSQGTLLVGRVDK